MGKRKAKSSPRPVRVRDIIQPGSMEGVLAQIHERERIRQEKQSQIGTCYKDEKGRVVFSEDFSGDREVIDGMALPKDLADHFDATRSDDSGRESGANRTISGVKPEATVNQGTGATRSDRTGKGRFDLIPECAWEVVGGSCYGPAREALCQLARLSYPAIGQAITEISRACGGSGQALIRLARRYEGGAAVHGDRNWEKGVPVSRCLDAARRHLCQALAGQIDEDHLGAALWNCVAMLHFWDTEHNDLLSETKAGVSDTKGGGE